MALFCLLPVEVARRGRVVEFLKLHVDLLMVLTAVRFFDRRCLASF